ncbi:hypothetical protein E4U42_005011 [Claviceps africana]|uniref:Uncharacterized protein n=1 Tax=Claviceps africana TaxID=83212 RepID=A0A8K0J4C8_9HYPO|nr:hypothetical protein E4U42_005011 [Claviceps africana]
MSAPCASPSTPRRDMTPSMRDRQARGKDPYREEGEGQESMVLGRGIPAEPFEDRERRSFALAVLDCPEQLMMFAQSRDDSIPSQRLRFTAMLCGFDKHTDAKGKRAA